MREEFERVVVEMVAERERIVANAAGHESRAVAALEVANLLGANGAGMSVAIPDTLLASLEFVPTYDNQTPVLDGLLNSGRVSEISDVSVRSAITRWERALTNVSDAEMWARTFSREQLMPAVTRRGEVGHITLAGGRRWAAALREVDVSRLDSIEWQLDPQRTTSLRSDPEIGALVAERYRSATLAAFSLDRLLERTDSLVRALQGAQPR